MSRIPRIIPDDSLVEVSNRCMQGRFLLCPSPELNEIILGVLGRALTLYPAILHAAVFLSNHYHLLATFPSTGVMSKFMGYLNRNLSIEIGKLHDWRGPMWQGRYHHSVVDDEPAIQIERLRYLLEQGVKEGLVASPAISVPGTFRHFWCRSMPTWIMVGLLSRLATPELVFGTPTLARRRGGDRSTHPIWHLLGGRYGEGLGEERATKKEQLL
jgi:REP element-mobilizing transposase RayT